MASPGFAQGLRPLCPERPGLGTTPCIVDKGHVLAELGLADWTRDKDEATKSDTLIAGDLLMRYGLDAVSEVQVGWTAYGHQRNKDIPSRLIDKSSGVGDILIGYKRSLSESEGSGFSAAIKLSATLPAGESAIGAGDWAAGLIVPVSVDIGAGLSLAVTPEIDANVDEDRDGRHLSYGTVAGLGVDLSKSINAAFEVSAFRDDDPSGHTTELLAAASLAWQASDNCQLDAGSAFGLNADSPDVRVYAGISRRF
ncbi:transporter [Sphingobium sp. SCG-1]|nr:transporter [Sphingobium sp. SCG-1]